MTKPDAPPGKAASFVSPVDFGREVCGELSAAEQREWLVSNGLGGFACGTVAGHLTRRYHGLLVAALHPPLGRTLLVTKVEEAIVSAGQKFSLSANRWASGAVEPQGFHFLERFHLEGAIPVWTFACADALLEKRIFLRHGENTACVEYRLVRAVVPLSIDAKVLVNYRDFHGATHAGNWQMRIDQAEHGLRVHAFEGAAPFFLLSALAAVTPAHEWYREFDLAVERRRGLDHLEDHLHAATFTATIEPGEHLALVFSTNPAAELDSGRLLAEISARENSLLGDFADSHTAAGHAPAWIRQLVLAADQFIVQRPSESDPQALSVIAGYPWFGDWGRDTMISLPGLAVTTGRPKIARNVLRSFSRFVDQGMLPNNFPESGSPPEYNTADATLWYFLAAREYFSTTRDIDFLRELYQKLEEILSWHIRGTRFGIHADPADGLLFAGEPGMALTWVDAKVDGRAVTPRIGKPVEINALWLNALAAFCQFAKTLGCDAAAYESVLALARSSYARFWNDSAGCCFDVLDGPSGHDATLRPNQIFAVSLPECALSLAATAAGARCLRPLAAWLARPSHPRSAPSRFSGRIPGPARATRRCLSPRHGVGMVAGAIRTGTSSRV